MFVILKIPNATSATVSKKTSAQRQRIDTNRHNFIRCCTDRITRRYNKLDCNSKPPCHSFTQLLNNQLSNIFIYRQYYIACLACQKFFIFGDPPTPQMKSNYECKKFRYVVCAVLIIIYWLSRIWIILCSFSFQINNSFWNLPILLYILQLVNLLALRRLCSLSVINRCPTVSVNITQLLKRSSKRRWFLIMKLFQQMTEL